MSGENLVHINAIRAEVDQLFSEIIEVNEIPEDYKVEVEFHKTKRLVFNHSKYFEHIMRINGKYYIRRKIDRRNRELLMELIKKDLDKFTKQHPDNNSHIFKKNRLEKLAEYQTRLCPNWERESAIKERELYYDFETYKEALEEVIPEVEEETTVVTEVKDKRQSTSKPKNDVRLKALMDILPEFVKQIKKIDGNKEEKGKLIELITGVNPTDAYKKVCTGVKLNITTKEQERIDIFKAMIEQISDKK